MHLIYGNRQPLNVVVIVAHKLQKLIKITIFLIFMSNMHVMFLYWTGGHYICCVIYDDDDD
jgi:hypothetical protein